MFRLAIMEASVFMMAHVLVYMYSTCTVHVCLNNNLKFKSNLLFILF